MSTGLMSCVRENSPPLETAGSDSGALSLPPNVSDQNRRRRFHPLRNLRRLFRRRTLANADANTAASSPSSSTSQMSSSSTVIAAGPAHSTGYYKTTSSPVDVTTAGMSSSAAYPAHLIGRHNVSNYGVDIMQPFHGSTSASGGFYGKESRDYSADVLKPKDESESREMTDYQRSLSEGRLVESDFNRDALSQSHDSVFSESATASSLSIVLKAELFDVLRKRRNRPDASDEDLGLPRSPTTPQRKEHIINQSEGSLSLLSMASSDLDEDSSNYGGMGDKTYSSISSKLSHDVSKTSDEIDLDISVGSRLSHSAARHKMAVRPKKKGPTRHRRPIESTILPSTPEVNEDVFKMASLDIKEISYDKTKSSSLPPGVNAKIIDQHSSKTITEMTTTNIKRSKTETETMSSSIYANKKLAKSFDIEKEQQECSSSGSTLERKEDDSGFFRRLLHRNSNKKAKKSTEEDAQRKDMEATAVKIVKTETSHVVQKSENKIEESVVEMKKEIVSETKSELTTILNTFARTADMECSTVETTQSFATKAHKVKSGPAARQRVMPKDLTDMPLPNDVKPLEHASPMFHDQERFDEHDSKPEKSSKILPSLVDTIPLSTSPPDNLDDNVFYDMSEMNTNRGGESPKTSSGEIPIPKSPKRSTEHQSHSMSPPKSIWSERYEKKDRPQHRSASQSLYQQKIPKADALIPEDLDIEISELPKPRKNVEKSKSFRYSDSTDDHERKNLRRKDNMPSLPDLTSKVSTNFEINDNNLIKLRRNEDSLPLSQGIYTKNIILTTSKPTPNASPNPLASPCSQNITEIEENIDKLVKSPFVTMLKSSNSPEPESTKHTGNISITPIRNVELTEKNIVEKPALSETIPLEIRIGENTAFIEKPGESFTDANDNETTSKCVKVSPVEIQARPPGMDRRILSEPNDYKVDQIKDKDARMNAPNKNKRNSSVFEKSSEHVPEFMKIQLNRVEAGRPKSHIVLSKNMKEVDDSPLTRRFSNENVEITDNKPPLPPDAVSGKRNSFIGTGKLTEEPPPKSPAKKVDIENNILKNTENTQLGNILVERRKSVTEEKLKYEKKVEELKSERKKSASDDVRIDSRKSSVDEETGVIMRKKSFTSNQSSNKEDTPELMKVFARRSSKIKDSDDGLVFDDIEKTSGGLKRNANVDSDKENQSSSEEKLDKLPKVEITIQTKVNMQNGLSLKGNDEKNTPFRKSTLPLSVTTPKPFVPPSRFGAVNFRNSSPFIDATKKTIQTQVTTTPTTTPTANLSNATVEQNNNINIITANNNVNDNAIKTIARSAIVSAPPSQLKTDEQPVTGSGEFKGILQRRAEWEKRAKEASK